MKSAVYWRNKLFSVGMIFFLILFVIGCEPSGWGPVKTGTAPTITSADNTTFTEGIAGTFTVTATGTPTPTFALTGALPSGVTFDTTTGVLSGTPATGTKGTYPLTITASNGVSPDATQSFTLTVYLAAFNTSSLPLAVTGSINIAFGGFTFDAGGNLLFAVNQANEIRSLNRITGAVTTIATGVSGGNTLLGITYNNGSIFVGAFSGNIYKVDPTSGSSTLFAIIPPPMDMEPTSPVNGIVIAPATFGSYGGQLIVATYNGYIYAVDQSVSSPHPVLITTIGGWTNALIFGSDGTLYVLDWDDRKIVTVTAAGVVADFATGFSSPSGLAINSSGGFLYVADPGDDTIKSVTIPGGVVSTIATSINFSPGSHPSPITYDATSNILLFGITTGSGETITYQAL
jgi:sugar lactone lactonase YvrE